ncbi:aminotransferase class V-fold PLP-dependent enzyme [candidate division KSB1 bacterium]
MNISEYRKEFPTLEKKTYLNTCSLGALSRRSKEYVHEFLEQWEEFGAWYFIWMKELAEVKELLAKIINADTEEIALGHSISTLLGTISSGFRFRTGGSIIVCDLDFPTANYQWLAKKPIGLETKILESGDKISVSPDEFKKAIDEKTELISTSHVFFSTGNIQDIETINRYSHEKEVPCLFDAYQSVGQVPVDVKKMNIDMLLGGGLKWLLGGPGITFLYIRKDLINKLEPTSVGWFGAKDQFGFSATDFSLSDTARRFETGTPSMAAVKALKGGLETILDIGLDNIQEATRSITFELTDRLENAGFSLKTAENPVNRSAIVMVRHDNPSGAVSELSERGIIVDFRKECIRVSPYFYNTSEEIEKFVNVLKEISK